MREIYETNLKKHAWMAEKTDKNLTFDDHSVLGECVKIIKRSTAHS